MTSWVERFTANMTPSAAPSILFVVVVVCYGPSLFVFVVVRILNIRNEQKQNDSNTNATKKKQTNSKKNTQKKNTLFWW